MTDAALTIRQTADGALAWALTVAPGTPDEALARLVRQAQHAITVVAAACTAVAAGVPDPADRITEPQRDLVARLASNAPGGLAAVTAHLTAAYGRPLDALDKAAASVVIAWLKGEGPAPAIPPAASAPADPDDLDGTLGLAGRPAPEAVATERARIPRAFTALGWGPAQQENWLLSNYQVRTAGQIPAAHVPAAIAALTRLYQRQAAPQGRTP